MWQSTPATVDVLRAALRCLAGDDRYDEARTICDDRSPSEAIVLTALKAKSDPENLFHLNQNIALMAKAAQ